MNQQQPTTPTPTATDSSIKETIESVIIAFILAFVFRAFVVEAFVIPTGSMAPTLLGQHVDMRCPMCGHEFVSGPRDYRGAVVDGRTERVAAPYQGHQPAGDGRSVPPLEIDCPMCGYPVTEQLVHTKAGDRILVLKYIYGVTEPRRWDVVVFRNPEQPTINYIKRLIGLPNESLQIVRGNVYTRPLDPATDEPVGPWRVQRKPPRVQRAVWQPVYHGRFVPLDAATRPWTSPWTPVGSAWSVEGHGRAYRYAGDGSSGDIAAGADLRFDFGVDPRQGMDFYAYNVLPEIGQGARPRPGRPLGADRFVEDLRIAASVHPDSLTTVQLDLTSDLVHARATVGTDGVATIALGKPHAESTLVEVARAAKVSWSAGESARVELWHADHAVTLWVNDEPVARHEIELAKPGETGGGPITLTMERLLQVGTPGSLPQASIRLAGGAARLTRVNLDRDLFYTDPGITGSLGVPGKPAQIGSDEFFCLGDNSPQSKDSRRWESVDPWITYHTRLGHTHAGRTGGSELDGVAPGYVPRKLMIGRAFFVYFPAPMGLTPQSFPVVVNFGDLRFID